MSVKPVPDGYHTLTPFLTVRDAIRAIEFYENAFGAVVRGVMKGPDGKVVNWHFELGPPNALFRLGWRKDSIEAGTEVDITGFRAKSAENTANGRSIVLPDGRELFSGGSAPGSEGKNK